MLEKSTCSSAEHLAKPSLLLDFGEDWKTPEETSPLPSARWQTTSTPSGLSGKTCQASSRRKTTPLDAFWAHFAGAVSPSFQSADGTTQVWFLARDARLHGAFLMLSTSEWPSAAGASLCALSEVLETGPLPQRYFLSPTACSGILRRAEKRGKALPPQLRDALTVVARTAPAEMLTASNPSKSHTPSKCVEDATGGARAT